MMMALRQMVDFDYAVPESWHTIPATPDTSGWERTVAGALCDGDENREVLEYRLRVAHPNLISDSHQHVAVWVPDRSVPEVAGVVFVDLVLPDPGRGLDREYYRGLIDPDQRTWCTVFSRTVEDVELPAGPALLVREVIAQREPVGSDEAEMAEEHTIYTVFPAGCSDALELMFWTPSLHLGADLAANAAAIMDTLSVVLEDGDRRA